MNPLARQMQLLDLLIWDAGKALRALIRRREQLAAEMEAQRRERRAA